MLTLFRTGVLFFFVTFSISDISKALALSEREMECLKALADSEFDLENVDRYEEWFDDHSAVTFAQSGTWTGLDEIVEYWNTFDSKYFDYNSLLLMEGPFDVSATDDECSSLSIFLQQVQLSADYSAPTCLQTAVAFKIQLRTDPEFKIKKMFTFLPKNFLHRLFSEGFDNNDVRDSVCDILESEGCTDVWEQNNLTGDLCREKYEALDVAGPDGYIDDNTASCRLLHSAYAETNPDHCPHLSFIPMADKKGRIKCQTSNNVVPASLFSEEQLEIIHNVSVSKFSLPDDTLVADCEYDPDRIPKAMPAPSSSPTSVVSSPATSWTLVPIELLVGLVIVWCGTFRMML